MSEALYLTAVDIRVFNLYFYFVFTFQLRSFKRQIEEAEEIAALNLAKFRKAQVDLEEAEERADLSDQALAKFKAMNKSRGTTPLPGQLNY